MYQVLFSKISKSNLKVLNFLTKIHGINYATAFAICDRLGIHPGLSCRYLEVQHVNIIIDYVKTINLKLSKDLIVFNKENVRREINLNTYKGLRHRLGLPVRGQRTHSNANSQRNLYRTRLFFG